MSEVSSSQPANVALKIKGASGQTANLLSVCQSDDTEIFGIDANGNFTSTPSYAPEEMNPEKIHDIRYVGGDYGFSSLDAALADQGTTSGGEIYVASGNHTMPATAVSVPSYTNVRGAGMSTKLQWTDTSTNPETGLSITIPSVPGDGGTCAVKISDMYLYGSTYRTGAAINQLYGTYVRLRDLRIKNWGGRGINVDGTGPSSFYSDITKCYISNCVDYGIRLYSARAWTLLSNNVHNITPINTSTAINLASTHNCSVIGGTVETGNRGIGIAGGPSNHVFGTYFEGLAYGVEFSSFTSNGSIRGCYAFSMGTRFVTISSANNIVVENNVCQWGNKNYCYYMTGDVTGCYARNNGGANAAIPEENTPWVFSSITAEPAFVEATYGGTGALFPQVVRGVSITKYVEQADQPALAVNGETQLWRDTDDSKVYLIARVNGSDKKVELT